MIGSWFLSIGVFGLLLFLILLSIACWPDGWPVIMLMWSVVFIVCGAVSLKLGI
jgi:hypothetical protein